MSVRTNCSQCWISGGPYTLCSCHTLSFNPVPCLVWADVLKSAEIGAPAEIARGCAARPTLRSGPLPLRGSVQLGRRRPVVELPTSWFVVAAMIL